MTVSVHSVSILRSFELVASKEIENNMTKFLNRAAKFLLLLFALVPASMLAAGNSSLSGIYKYPSQEKINKQVDSVFRKLSTREKIAQIMVINFTSKESNEIFETQKRLVKKEKIGGVIPLGDVSFYNAVQKLNTLNKLAKIPMLVTLDAEWGASMRWPGIPAFQYFIQMGALSSDSLVYEVGKSIAEECRALKVQVNYSPDVDLNNNPDRHIVHFRSFGEDKEKASRFGIAMMHGLQDGGVATSAKHFPGHGDTDVDSHLALPLLPYSRQRLDSIELYPFRRIIAEGVDMVMVGHMSIPALDSTGTPSSISKPIVTGLLREEMGFNGIIITDALDMFGVSKESGLEKKYIPLAAFKAGVDILLMPEDVENSITIIEEALENGEITMEELDLKVKKMLALKSRLGVFEKSYDPIIDMDKLNRFMDQDLKDGVMDKKLNLIKRVSKETMTLVFNDNSAGYGIPVSFENKKVAYVGFRHPELGHEFGVLANRYGKVDTLLFSNNASLEELKIAREKFKEYDLIVFGYNGTELRASTNYGIKPEEINFITDWAAQQPMIVMYFGTPYAIPFISSIENFTAFVVGYAPSQANVFAATQLVFGGIPAKGVLPVSTARFKEGESVLIPDRFREEYHHFAGSKDDSLSLIQYDMKEMGAALTLLPQVSELVAGNKIRLSNRVGELLGEDAAGATMSVAELLTGYRNGNCADILKEILGKYRSYISIEEAAREMFSKLGMHSTAIDGTVVTTAYDYNKFLFTVNNGGKYAGKQILSPKAAELVLEFMNKGCGEQ